MRVLDPRILVNMPEQHAYVVRPESPSSAPLVSWGTDIAEAARRASAALGGERILELQLLGELLPGAGTSGPSTSDGALPTDGATEPTKKSRATAPPKGFTGTVTRAEQLAHLLIARGRPVHVDEIAQAMSINRANAQNVVRAAMKAGLVERIGRRTGKVRLAGNPGPSEDRRTTDPTDPPSSAISQSADAPRGSTRGEQLANLLEREGRDLHVDEIAGAFGTSRANAHNIIRAGLDAGLVERVGSRTGKVRRTAVTATGSGARESIESARESTNATRESPAGARESAPATELTAIQRRALTALRELGGAQTAKEVAGVLGCRPREAGNALTLLTESGLVQREAGEQPTKYRLDSSGLHSRG